MKGDPYNHKKELKRLEKRLEEADISSENKETLQDFLTWLKQQAHSKSRIIRYVSSWKILLENTDIDYNIEEAGKEDIRKLVGLINQNQIKERDLSDHTLVEYKKSIRKMYAGYLSDVKDIPGESMCNFFTLTKKKDLVDPDLLPKPRTVKELIRNSDRVRGKAFIAILWSSGGRVSEVLGLQWKNVRFNDSIVKLTFEETKTGGKRIVPLRAGYLYLKQLQDMDELSDNRDAYIFRKIREKKGEEGEQLSYNAAKNIIYRAAEEAEIKDKKVNPHAFRKGRATFLAAKGMNQAQLCEYFGWAQGSKEAAKYIRLAESDVENSIKEISGLGAEAENGQEKDINPVECFNCKSLNVFEAENCTKCGQALTTSDFYEEQKKKEIEDQITTELALGQLDYDRDDIKQKAKELYEEQHRGQNDS